LFMSMSWIPWLYVTIGKIAVIYYSKTWSIFIKFQTLLTCNICWVDGVIFSLYVKQWAQRIGAICTYSANDTRSVMETNMVIVKLQFPEHCLLYWSKIEILPTGNKIFVC
jgi:hypothetical protein